MYLYGASGHAKVIIDIVNAMGQSVDGLFDDDEAVSSLSGVAVKHQWSGEGPMIVSIGNNRIRKKVVERLKGVFAKAIHPSAVLSPTVSVADGTVIMPGAVVNADANIGRHCIINTSASVDHDCSIDDYVHISPHATLCGGVKVGEGTWVGAGAVVIPGIHIGKWCTIGAGAVVIRDVPDNMKVVGNPAQEIPFH